MHLVDLLSLRSIPAAGLTIGLTQRCPLNCAHCSTNSTMASPQFSADMFERFIKTFTKANRPDVIAISGGEAMLRPNLVRLLSECAHEVGTRSTVLSGLFFARSGRIPLPIHKAIRSVDHFSVSIDTYHEQVISRENVFLVLHSLLDEGINLSIHIAGHGAEDTYLINLIDDVRRTFNDKIPMLVNSISAFGRAKSWMATTEYQKSKEIEANPCSMAAWPVLGFDGTIIACGNDNVFENIPEHLLIGHANTSDWATIKERCLTSSMLRAIRLFGPEYVAEHFQNNKLECSGYCQTCMNLTSDPKLEEQVTSYMAKPSIGILEQQNLSMQKSAGAISFARRHGIARYADLVTIGMQA